MRDIIVTLIVIVGCIYTLKRAYIGILLWSWLSYMNPHRLCYGFAYSMPFAQVAAIVLIFAMFFSKEVKKIPLNALTVIWMIFVFYMGVTTLFAFFPDDAMTYYIRVIKIQLTVFLTIMLITDKIKIRHLIWVITLSIGFFSIKGGAFTLLSGGNSRVYGPPGSMVEENNSLAVATLMTIPLMVYLYQTQEKKWIKNGLLIAIALSFISAIGSQSRGALLSLCAVIFYFWMKSDKKIVSGVAFTVVISFILMFMPESWYQRMHTIETYQQDSSAMGRLNAWEYAINAANNNFLGVGFDSWSLETFALYAPNPFDVHAAHSIYFSVLADHGWFGLLLYVSILLMAWFKLKRLIKNSSDNEMALLGKMIRVSFIAYFSGGAFLSLSYFDLPWHLIGIVCILDKYYVLESAQQVDARKI